MRILRVIKYGWWHSREYCSATGRNRMSRFAIFADMLRSYIVYRMYTDRYMALKYRDMDSSMRKKIGRMEAVSGRKRDLWRREFNTDHRLLCKYGKYKYNLPHLRERRRRAYSFRYNAGKNLTVEHDVQIQRQHYLEGTIKIGDDVFLAKHVFIDYSGLVEIGSGVQINHGAVIETHRHHSHSDYREAKDNITPSALVIGDGAVIGASAIILPSCRYIGKYARVGAGAVVTHDVPDYAIVAGVPARLIRMQPRAGS